MSPTRNIIAWILQIILALAFIASGGNKLFHLADTVKGLAAWASRVGLCISLRRLRYWGALDC
jgi:uncharacterized membrane protein YphA (DoxX/SURF4 family)